MTAVYRSYFAYGNGEIANAARVGGLALVDAPTSDAAIFGTANACSCSAGLVGYRDWWEGHEEFFGGGPYTDVTTAPWYSADRCESARFHGIWPMDVEGLGPVKIQREIVESFCDGGHPTRHRDMARSAIRVEAMLVACDHAAAVYGLQWLTCELRQAAYTRGADLTYLAASPQDSCVEPASLLRTIPDAVLLVEPTIIDASGGTRGKQNRHGSLWRIEWVWGSGSPYAYGPAQDFPVVWDEDQADPIEWSTDCDESGGCPVPVEAVYNPGCPPVELPEAAALPTGCQTDVAGCTPLCEGRQRVWEWSPPASVAGVCGETVIDIWVTNPSPTEPLFGVNLAWVPCGGDRDCDRVAEISISYIPPGAAVVLDSVRGRPRVLQNGNWLQAAGLVRTPNGPWSGLTLDGFSCWELVLSTDPDTDPEVTIWARPRDV